MTQPREYYYDPDTDTYYYYVDDPPGFMEIWGIACVILMCIAMIFIGACCVSTL